jgi:hypothetical protein
MERTLVARQPGAVTDRQNTRTYYADQKRLVREEAECSKIKTKVVPAIQVPHPEDAWSRVTVSWILLKWTPEEADISCTLRPCYSLGNTSWYPLWSRFVCIQRSGSDSEEKRYLSGIDPLSAIALAVTSVTEPSQPSSAWTSWLYI